MISEYPQAGRMCWVNDCVGYPLPDGLEARSQVLVIEELMPHFAVEDSRGRRWKLFLTQLDAGHTYWLDGQPYFESHPRVVHYLLHAMRHMDREPSTGPDHEQAKVERKSRIRWYLERHGNDPDGSLPPGPPPIFTGAPRRTLTGSPRAPQRFRPEVDGPVKRMKS